MLSKTMLIACAALMLAGCAKSEQAAKDNTAKNEAAKIQDKGNDMSNIEFNTITGEPTSLAAYKDKVVLIVNVASECGNTPQYAGLEKLYEQYKDSGLVVLGFPANNFGGQEPGSNEDILKFCSTEYAVTFPMMAKVSVKGEDKHPLFVDLTEKSSLPGEISWNFGKFLIDREGHLAARFDPKVQPESDEVVSAIKKLL